MKAQMLKIAGVKSDKAFYKKYPTEAAFFKAHPEAKKLVKAQMGAYIGGETAPTPEMVPFQEYLNQADKMVTGFTEEERRKRMKEEAEASQKDSGSGGGMDMSGMMSMFSNMGGGMSGGGARYGTHIPKAQWGNETEGPLSSNPGFVEGMGQNNINGYGVNNAGYTTNGNATTGYNATSSGGGNGTFDAMKGVPVIGGIIKGVAALEAEKKAKKAAEQAFRTSQITLAASATKPEQIKRRYVTPWDNPVQPGQMFPPNGVGSNILAAKNGTEIQNTYAPGTLYDDLGYEPMYDSENYIPKAQFGIASAGGEGFGENPYGSMGGTSGSSQIGGSIGSIFGPAGGMVGSIIGGAFDKNQSAIDRYNRGTAKNIQAMSLNNGFRGLVGGYSSHMEDGGYISNDWTPQVITQFGGLDQQDFYDYAHEGMDSLRSGGHLKGEYTPVSERGLKTYDLGGRLEVDDRGDVDFMGYNPITAQTGASGYIGISRGPSHDHGGFNFDYNGNKVEVEGGETVVEKQDGGSVNDTALNILGNMFIGEQGKSVLADVNKSTVNKLLKGKDIKDVKFKTLGNNIAKKTKSLNDAEDRYVKLSDSANTNAKTDFIRLNTAQAGLTGVKMQYQDLHNFQDGLVNLQTAYHDAAKEFGYEDDTPKFLEDIKKEKVQFNPQPTEEYSAYGEDGVSIAQNGKKVTFKSAQEAKKAGYSYNSKTGNWENRTQTTGTSGQTKVAIANVDVPRQHATKEGFYGNVNPALYEEFKKNNPWFEFAGFNPNKKADVEYFQRRFNEEAKKAGSTAQLTVDGLLGDQTASAKLKENQATAPGEENVDTAEVLGNEKIYPVEPAKRNLLMDIAGQIMPFIRPTDQEDLNYNQLMGEMFALSNNQVEPVQAQGYRPDLGNPYDITYQDILNENQADFRGTQNLLGGNPAALAILNAQKYGANQKVLGEQFRANQAERSRVFENNRTTLNDAQLKNLAIFDKQYERQEQAKSNSKAVAQAALNSISDKYAQNRKDNRELGIYENMYNYRFDPAGRAINMNAPWQANTPIVYNKGDQTPNMQAVYDKDGNFIRWEAMDKTNTDNGLTPIPSGATNPIQQQNSKNGGKLSARNGSIVSMYKNL